MVGRFVFQKGYDILFDAVKQSADILRNHKVMIAIIGDGDQKQYIKKKILKYALNDIIILCGSKINAQRFLPLADGLLITSRWEGLPLIVLEAGNNGIPVIGSAAPGISSIIKNDKTGILFPNENPDALAKLFTNPKLFTLLPKLGTSWHNQVLKEFDIKQTIKKLDILYQTIIK